MKKEPIFPCSTQKTKVDGEGRRGRERESVCERPIPPFNRTETKVDGEGKKKKTPQKQTHKKGIATNTDSTDKGSFLQLGIVVVLLLVV